MEGSLKLVIHRLKRFKRETRIVSRTSDRALLLGRMLSYRIHFGSRNHCFSIHLYIFKKLSLTHFSLIPSLLAHSGTSRPLNFCYPAVTCHCAFHYQSCRDQLCQVCRHCILCVLYIYIWSFVYALAQYWTIGIMHEHNISGRFNIVLTYSGINVFLGCLYKYTGKWVII